MKFVIATILLAACAAVQGRSVQVHPIISMLDYPMGSDTRIIDGTDATKGQFPWQAALFATTAAGTYMCGGSLISDRWVLTAAHCVTGATEIEVRLGGVQLFAMEYIQVSREFLYHEKYNPQTVENDVGLISLPVPVTLSANVQIIPLAARSQPVPDRSKVTASGFGQTLTGDISFILQWVDLTATTNDICSRFYPGAIFSSTLCAHGAPHHNICKRDSGGALIQYNPDAVQVGINSFVTTKGCHFGYPSGYARVSSFLDWISQHTGIPVRD